MATAAELVLTRGAAAQKQRLKAQNWELCLSSDQCQDREHSLAHRESLQLQGMGTAPASCQAHTNTCVQGTHYPANSRLVLPSPALRTTGTTPSLRPVWMPSSVCHKPKGMKPRSDGLAVTKGAGSRGGKASSLSSTQASGPRQGSDHPFEFIMHHLKALLLLLPYKPPWPKMLL